MRLRRVVYQDPNHRFTLFLVTKYRVFLQKPRRPLAPVLSAKSDEESDLYIEVTETTLEVTSMETRERLDEEYGDDARL